MEVAVKKSKPGKIRFMLRKMFLDRMFLVAFLVIAAVLAYMYYNAVSHSSFTFAVLPPAHEVSISLLAGIVISLGISSNLFVMKVVMGSGKDTIKAARLTTLSMVAGACGCVSSFVSVFVSLGIGAGVGLLAFLAANSLIVLAVAVILSLASLKLAGNTLSKFSSVVRF